MAKFDLVLSGLFAALALSSLAIIVPIGVIRTDRDDGKCLFPLQETSTINEQRATCSYVLSSGVIFAATIGFALALLHVLIHNDRVGRSTALNAGVVAAILLSIVALGVGGALSAKSVAFIEQKEGTCAYFRLLKAGKVPTFVPKGMGPMPSMPPDMPTLAPPNQPNEPNEPNKPPNMPDMPTMPPSMPNMPNVPHEQVQVDDVIHAVASEVFNREVKQCNSVDAAMAGCFLCMLFAIIALPVHFRAKSA